MHFIKPKIEIDSASFKKVDSDDVDYHTLTQQL